MNILSKLLDKAVMTRKIGFHPRCSLLKLSHLCFADDILVFSDGKKRSVEGVISVFDEFADMSGLMISLEKSTMYLAGVSDTHRQSILTDFHFTIGHLPVRYLGLPLMTRQMRHSDCLPLLEKIRSTIGSWTVRCLSFAGRLMLVKSVLSSIINFWMTAFCLPSKCILEIESLFSSFLWSGPALNTKRAKVAWADVCKLKDEGGIGLRKLKDVNRVMMLKLIWKICSGQQSLWVHWIQVYLIQKSSFWSLKSSTIKGSWVWKKLLKYREVAKGFLKASIGNGEHIAFWYDNWSSLGCLWEKVGERGCIDFGIGKEATLAEILSRRRRRHRIQLYEQIEEELQKVVLQRECEDIYLWKSKGGGFKAGFSSADTWFQLREAGPNLKWGNGIWFSHSTPKFSFITWLAFRNRLSTGSRMQLWNAGAIVKCMFCDEILETREHLFFRCRYSKSVWEPLAKGLMGNRYTTDWTNLMGQIINGGGGKTRTFLFRYVFQVSIYLLWRERNGRRHGEVSVPPECLVGMIDIEVRNKIASVRRTDRSMEDALITWFEARQH